MIPCVPLVHSVLIHNWEGWVHLNYLWEETSMHLPLVAALYLLHFKAASVFGIQPKLWSSSPRRASNKSLNNLHTKACSIVHFFKAHISKFLCPLGGIEWLTLEVTWLPRSNTVPSQLRHGNCYPVSRSILHAATQAAKAQREKAQHCGVFFTSGGAQL